MTKYIFAKRTMHIFKREDGPFDKETIEQLDKRYISEGRAIQIEDTKPSIEQETTEKKEETIQEEIKERIEEIVEDLEDDGKLNYSNNKDKKSPGRRSSKKKK